MRKGYRTLLNNIPVLEPPKSLSQAILTRVETEKRNMAKTRMFVRSAISAISFIALFPAIQYTFQEFVASGFYDYFSLIFTDATALLPIWKEFALTLAESVPLFGLILTFSLVFIFLESLKSAVANMNIAFYRFN